MERVTKMATKKSIEYSIKIRQLNREIAHEKNVQDEIRFENHLLLAQIKELKNKLKSY